MLPKQTTKRRLRHEKDSGNDNGGGADLRSLPRNGGGNIFLEGDKKEYEAAGHCAAYNIDGQDIFICHGYSVAQQGASLLIQRPITWTSDGWPSI